MARRDDLHYVARRALERDGWTITHDPLKLSYEDLPLLADLGAERALAAEKAGRKIAVEVKDFDSSSPGNELQKLIGQMQLYQCALDDQEPDRELFLAINQLAFTRLFQKAAFQRAVKQNGIKLVVIDSNKEVILQWIKP